MNHIRKPGANGNELNEEAPSGSSVDIAVEHLRRFIMKQGMQEGEVLPSEADLAIRFGMSRNTMREAIRTLKAYGLVESRRHVGAVIIDRRREAMMNLFSFAMDINIDSFRDVQGFRRLIEINVTDALMKRADQSYLDVAAAINQRMRDATDAAEGGELDYQFHRTLVDSVGNRTLSEIYGLLQPVISRFCELGKTSPKGGGLRAYEEHALILDALRRKNSIEVAYHYSVHLDSGREFIRGSSAAPEVVVQEDKGIDRQTSL